MDSNGGPPPVTERERRVTLHRLSIQLVSDHLVDP